MYLNELRHYPIERESSITVRQRGLLGKIGIDSVYDLLTYYPFRYEDRSVLETIADSLIGERAVTVIATIIEHQFIFAGGKRHPKIVIQDEKNRAFLIGFNRQFLTKSLKIGSQYWINAQFTYKFNEIQASSFDFEEYQEGIPPKSFGGILPIYKLTESLSVKELRSVIQKILYKYQSQIDDELPTYITQGHNLIDKATAMEWIHFSKDFNELKKAKLRLAYEEFFAIQLIVTMKRNFIKETQKDQSYPDKAILSRFIDELPFRLTRAQENSLSEIISDMQSPRPMHRLLQGDVGSGKTVVAIATMLLAAGNGNQSAMMAPTETLARQHYQTLNQLIGGWGIPIGLLTGSTKTEKREEILSALESGHLKILVGTHALLTEDVVFQNLCHIIFDEQHKFGVSQRIALSKKAKKPDILVMTATPIPRTLTLTLYGDLDISIIDEKPANRLDIQTRWIKKHDYAKLLDFVENELKKGRQAYFIYPLVEESEKLDFESVKKRFIELQKHFTQYRVDIIHGRLSQAEKERVMEDFYQNRNHILVSTTVVEVGIDVPNATVMVVEGAERFGLSQLHQLRGRIGRSDLPSTCFLVTSPEVKSDTETRMKVMVETNDGFKIAEEDLKIRGPGEILGVRQSGLPELKIADYMRDEKLLILTRKDAQNILADDPELSKLKNVPLKNGIICSLENDFLHSG